MADVKNTHASANRQPRHRKGRGQSLECRGRVGRRSSDCDRRGRDAGCFAGVRVRNATLQFAAVSSDLARTDTKEAVSSTETLDESLPDSSQMLGPETPPVQIATASALDLVHSDAKEAVSSSASLDQSLPDPSQALAPKSHPTLRKWRAPTKLPTNARRAKSASTNTCGRCTSGRPRKTPSRWSSEGK